MRRQGLAFIYIFLMMLAGSLLVGCKSDPTPTPTPVPTPTAAVIELPHSGAYPAAYPNCYPTASRQSWQSTGGWIGAGFKRPSSGIQQHRDGAPVIDKDWPDDPE